MKWEKIRRTVNSNGESTTTYASGDFRIESRKRAIPHAASKIDGGYWMHTTYWLIRPDGTEKEYWRLQDAKEAAEA